MAPLKEVKKCIYSSIYFVLTVVNPKMILGKFLDPPDLTRPQTLCIHESKKVVVVSQDIDFVFAAF